MLNTSTALALETEVAAPVDLASLSYIKQSMNAKDERVYGYFGDKRLDSAFQPIYSLPHRRIVGHEGLLRATKLEGKNISPIQVFNGDGRYISDAQCVFLDRLCRTIHLHNYQLAPTNNHWLFLNVSAQVINRRRDHGPFFAELMASYGISPKQVVVEIVEGVIPDAELLDEAVKFYRDLGCLIAIDDFGAEASDIERIWRVSPDIVKLDRKMIAAAEFNDKARRILRATVALIHESGSLALIEGVENREQAIIALDSNADLVQGFYFAMPTPTPLQHGDGGIGELADKKPSVSMDELLPYMAEFKFALQHLAENRPMKSACASLIDMEKIDRCYVIDAHGKQLGASMVAKRLAALIPFLPLADADGADWSRKPYHYRAMFQPGELQISRPNLSVASSQLCVTLSATFQLDGKLSVLCCDVEWRGSSGREVGLPLNK
jgi:EAL domain-containing protein (putative c-di-GMP-specific phosphodiesterase class I)